MNEQWPAYWAALFERHGYVFCDCIRPRVWEDPGVEWFYAQNVFLVVPKDRAPEVCDSVLIGASRALVHPRLWEACQAGSLNFRSLLRAMPSAASRALVWRLGAAGRKLLGAA